MALNRRVETFVAGYVGFGAEATAVSGAVMDDLGEAPGAGPARQNFFIQDRSKQYWGMDTAIVVRNGGTPVVNSGATAYTVQRVGGIVRFAQPQTLTQTNDVHTLTWGAGGAGTLQIVMPDENGVQWTSATIGPTATTGQVGTAIDAATPSVAVPGYTNPFAGTNIVEGAGPLGTAAITLTGGGPLAGQFITPFILLSGGVTTGVPTLVHSIPGSSGITVDTSYLPMYFLKGGMNLANNSTAQKIDTTGSGDARQNAVPGRPDDELSFGLRTGPKITLANGTVRTIENRLLAARDAAEYCVFSFVDDISDPYQPRDAMFGFVGSANKTRQMNQGIERQVQVYAAIPNDGTVAVVNLDYIA